MRKNKNSSFYHYCSILYGEDMEEELDRTYFMTLKEMSNYYNVHPSSLGKVIRYKKFLKKIPNTIFKRVYEPVFIKVCNEVKNPKVDMFVEEIDTKPYEEKENHSFKFFEAEEEDKQIDNQQEVKVSMLNGYTTTTTLIDNEFDNQMIINMNMKSQKHKKSQNQPANVNIKLVNDIDNLFQQTQSIEQDNSLEATHTEATHTETKHTEEPQAKQIEDNSIQIEIISKNKPQNRNNDLNVELQYIEKQHTEEKQTEEKQTEEKQTEEKHTEEQTNYSMINNFSFNNDLTDIDDKLDILSKKENDIKVEEKNIDTQNEFSSYFFNDEIEDIIDEKKIEQEKQKQTQQENRTELDIFFEECDITNKIDINDLSTDELDELDKSNLEEFTPSFF
jgi:hypothetical protein